MTDAFIRVERDGKWQAVEIEHLTDSERRKAMQGRKEQEILNWLDIVCHELARLDNGLNSGRE